MNTLTINIDLATTPVDAVAEVLRILNGSPISAPVAAAPSPDVATASGADLVKEISKKEAKKEAQKTDDKPEAPAKAVTIEEVRAAVAEKRTSHRQEIKDILTKYGTESVTNLDPTKYAAVRDEIKAL